MHCCIIGSLSFNYIFKNNYNELYPKQSEILKNLAPWKVFELPLPEYVSVLTLSDVLEVHGGGAGGKASGLLRDPTDLITQRYMTLAARNFCWNRCVFAFETINTFDTINYIFCRCHALVEKHFLFCSAGNVSSLLNICYTAMHGVGKYWSALAFEAFGLHSFVPVPLQVLWLCRESPDTEIIDIRFFILN